MKDRIYLYDNVKMIMIWLVVLGHSMETFVNNSHILKSTFIFIYTFHMPMFILVAGLFSKGIIANEKKWRNKVFFYFILYFTLKFVRTILNVCLGKAFVFRFFWEDGLPWFMLVMAVYLIITRLFKDFSLKWLLVCSIILACICGYDPNTNDYLAASRIVTYYPFFLLGYMLDYRQLTDFVKSKKVALPAILFLLAFTCFVYFRLDSYYQFRPLLTGRNPFNALKDSMKNGEVMYLYGGFYRLIYYFLVTVVMVGIIAITPKRKLPFSHLGQRTLTVYFYHLLALQIIRTTDFYPMLNSRLHGLPLLIAHIVFSALLVLVFSIPFFGKPFEWIEKSLERLP